MTGYNVIVCRNSGYCSIEVNRRDPRRTRNSDFETDVIVGGAGGRPVCGCLIARMSVAPVISILRKPAPNVMPCDTSLRKDAEMGWFEHGSTIIVFTPDGYAPCDDVREGTLVRVGQALLRLSRTPVPTAHVDGPPSATADPGHVS